MIGRWLRWYTAIFNPSKLVWDEELNCTRPWTPADLIENNPDRLREFADGAEKVVDALQLIAEKARQAVNPAGHPTPTPERQPDVRPF